MPHARDPQHLELVVLADRRERDAVVDLADLRAACASGLSATMSDARLRTRARRGCGRGRCPSARSRRGPSSPVRARRRTACSFDASPPRSRPSSSSLGCAARRRPRRAPGSRPASIDRDRAGRCRARDRGRRWRRPRRPRRTAPGSRARSSRRRVMPSRHPALIQLRAWTLPEPWRLVVVLLVAAAGDVVGEDAAGPRLLVVARRTAARPTRPCIAAGRLRPDQLAELVGLALEAQRVALHLLVVLELDLEQLHHLDRGPGRAGDRDARRSRRPANTLSMRRLAIM